MRCCQSTVACTWLKVNRCSASSLAPRVGERRPHAFEQRVGPELARGEQRPHHALVLLQVAGAVGDADARADRHQLREFGHARRAQVHGQGDAGRAHRADPRDDRAGVEAHLRGHVRGVALLLQQHLEQHVVGDVDVTLGIAGHADLGERVARFVDRPQQHQAVVELPVVLRVAAHDERPAEAGLAASIEQLAQMRAVADHVRRQVRDRRRARGRRPPRRGRAWPRSRGWVRPSP